MNKIGISTAHTVDRYAPEAGVKAIHDAGFDCMDYNFDEYLPGSKIASGEFTPFIEQPTEKIIESQQAIKDASKKYGVEFSQMHAPFQLYVYGNDEINEHCYEIIDKTMAVAQFLGVPQVVLHPNTLTKFCSLEEERKINLEYFKRMIPIAQKYGVGICLENMFGWGIRHALQGCCADAEEAVWYMETLNKEAGDDTFGFCLDTGHIHITCRDYYRTITTLGSHLKILHMHENNGEQDMHALPFTYSCFFLQTPEPTLNWNDFCRGLADIGYSGTLNFETCGSMQMFPKDTHDELRALIASCGRHFAREIERYKAQK